MSTVTDNLSPAKIRERADRPNTLIAFSNEEALIVATAIETADALATRHIVHAADEFVERAAFSGIGGGSPEDGRAWLAGFSKDDPLIERSLAYLESRGLLERHADQPWVRIKEASA